MTKEHPNVKQNRRAFEEAQKAHNEAEAKYNAFMANNLSVFEQMNELIDARNITADLAKKAARNLSIAFNGGFESGPVSVKFSKQKKVWNWSALSTRLPESLHKLVAIREVRYRIDVEALDKLIDDGTVNYAAIKDAHELQAQRTPAVSGLEQRNLL